MPGIVPSSDFLRLRSKKIWLFEKDVIKGHEISRPEVVFMRATLLISFLVFLWVASLCLAQAESPGKKLIPVKPSYHEATYVPQAEQPAADPTLPPPPTPREQMYVFWILGKMLSYPIDKAESYVSGFTKKSKPPAEGTPTPATATATPNPFSSVNWSEIPPAPPVSGRAGKSR
jgi:hypothetical protein